MRLSAAARHPRVQAQVELQLPGHYPLLRRGLQHLQLGLVVRGSEVLDFARARRDDDLPPCIPRRTESRLRDA